MKGRLKYGHIRTYPAKVGGKSFRFRSKWERNIAVWLEWRKLKGEIKAWEFEPKIFKIAGTDDRKVKSYLPDFKVLKNDDTVEWVEVKGRKDAASIIKIKKFREQYNETLKVIDAAEYNRIKSRFGLILKFI